MANETIITWSFANWITVILMAAVGFALLGFAMKVYQQKKQKAA
ncbi:MAG TPA: hypothetical protein VN785_12190 [Candidatus Angelobacter sp.]|nr:hypothetical protein [Candidatus Angelobacter sp.]